MLHVAERGTGSHPVVLLHGFLGSGRNMGSLARRWSEQDPRLRLLLVDLPGHGDSPPLAEPTLEAMVAPVVELIEGTQARWVLGHSLGGRVALACRRHLSTPLNVVLLDISPDPTDRQEHSLDAVFRAFLAAPEQAADRHAMADHLRSHNIPEPLVQWLLLNLQRDDGGVSWKVNRDDLRRFSAEASAHSLWDTLGPHGATVCIRGANSDFVSDTTAARLREHGCPVHDVPNAGHFVHADNLPALLDLLSGVPSG